MASTYTMVAYGSQGSAVRQRFEKLLGQYGMTLA